ncbi:MAG TPA: hypothetical protein VNE63_06230 [Candidatus Acidoferrales bacterium]|nr:hypothetical protein [Candidatus Acidoferrales bacterium]
MAKNIPDASASRSANTIAEWLAPGKHSKEQDFCRPECRRMRAAHRKGGQPRPKESGNGVDLAFDAVGAATLATTLKAWREVDRRFLRLGIATSAIDRTAAARSEVHAARRRSSIRFL